MSRLATPLSSLRSTTQRTRRSTTWAIPATWYLTPPPFTSFSFLVFLQSPLSLHAGRISNTVPHFAPRILVEIPAKELLGLCVHYVVSADTAVQIVLSVSFFLVLHRKSLRSFLDRCVYCLNFRRLPSFVRRPFLSLEGLFGRLGLTGLLGRLKVVEL